MANFCGKCGTQMGQNTKFCGNCGWNSEENKVQQNQQAEGYSQLNSTPINQGNQPSNSEQGGYTQINSTPVNQGSQSSSQQQGGYTQVDTGQNHGGQPSYAQPMNQGGHASYDQEPVKKSKLKGCLITLVIIGLILFVLFKAFGFVVQKLEDIGISGLNIEMPFGSSVSPEDINGTWSMSTMTTSVDSSNLDAEYQDVYNSFIGIEYSMNMKFILDDQGVGKVFIKDKGTNLEFESPIVVNDGVVEFKYQDETGNVISSYEGKISKVDDTMFYDGTWKTTMLEPNVSMTGILTGSRPIMGTSVTELDLKKALKEATQDDYLGIWEGSLRFDVDNLDSMPDMDPNDIEQVKEALDAEHNCKLEITEDGLILTMYVNFKGSIKEEEMDEMIYEVIDGVLYTVLPEEEMDGGTGAIEMMITELNSPKRLLGRMQFDMPMPNGKLGSMGVDIDLYQ